LAQIDIKLKISFENDSSRKGSDEILHQSPRKQKFMSSLLKQEAPVAYELFEKINKVLNLEIQIEEPEHDEDGKIIPKMMNIKEDPELFNS